MAFVVGRCKECDSKITVDTSKIAGICGKCGTPYVTEEVFYTQVPTSEDEGKEAETEVETIEEKKPEEEKRSEKEPDSPKKEEGGSATVVVKDDKGIEREVKLGFSWTVLFFNFFVPLIRADFKWAGIIFALTILAGYSKIRFAAFLVSLAFAFIYNKIYIKELLAKGYKPVGVRSRDILQSRGFM